MSNDQIKILVVEDVLSNRLVLERILEPYGSVMGCESGENGLESFCFVFENGEPFELVIVDVSLPGISGIALVQQIRDFEEQKNLSSGEGVRILVITSNDDAAVRQKAADAGADGFLTKPISLEILQRVLADLGF